MKILCSTLLAAALLIATAAAQEGMGTGGTRADRYGNPNVPSLGQMLVRVSGEVLKVDTDRKAIQIRTKSDKKEAGVLLDPKCKIKADKDDFGKKEMALEEIEPGYMVDLTIRRADMRVTEIKVKKPKQASNEERTGESKKTQS